MVLTFRYVHLSASMARVKLSCRVGDIHFDFECEGSSVEMLAEAFLVISLGITCAAAHYILRL